MNWHQITSQPQQLELPPTDAGNAYPRASWGYCASGWSLFREGWLCVHWQPLQWHSAGTENFNLQLEYTSRHLTHYVLPPLPYSWEPKLVQSERAESRSPPYQDRKGLPGFHKYDTRWKEMKNIEAWPMLQFMENMDTWIFNWMKSRSLLRYASLLLMECALWVLLKHCPGRLTLAYRARARPLNCGSMKPLHFLFQRDPIFLSITFQIKEFKDIIKKQTFSICGLFFFFWDRSRNHAKLVWNIQFPRHSGTFLSKISMAQSHLLFPVKYLPFLSGLIAALLISFLCTHTSTHECTHSNRRTLSADSHPHFLFCLWITTANLGGSASQAV